MGILNFLKKVGKPSEKCHTVPPINEKQMTTNLKNVYTEMWILSCLNSCAMTVFEMLNTLKEKSDGVFEINYPAVVIYRLESNNCITEIPNNNEWRCLEITDKGREYLSKLRQCHELFVEKNNVLLKSIQTRQVS